MIVTAVLAIRNEEAYLANCLRHLIHNGVRFAIIDNGSTDASAEIYRASEFAANLVAAFELPFEGVFSLAEQLRRKMALINAIETDWIIHLDADEVMHSYRPAETLSEALSRLDGEGWNAVNFDEFVFLPIEHDYATEAPGPQPMAHYYFFEPSAPRLMRAWRKASGFSLVEGGGHLLAGPDLRLAPEHLALRHYIFRSQDHAFAKYGARTFAPDEIARGWHVNRINQPRASFLFPPVASLKRLAFPAHRGLDRGDPWRMHYWERSQSNSSAV
jgi:glycosyltransferase involved in cell wall biosynthesis